MARTQLLFILLCIVASLSHAIKGGRVRKLVDSPVQNVGTSFSGTPGDCKKKEVPVKGKPGKTAVKSEEEEDSRPFCASKVSKKKRKKGECDALRQGKLPKNHRKIEAGVGVQFKYDESAQSPQEFRMKAQKIAKKAGPKAAGCEDALAGPFGGRRLVESLEDDNLAISGVEFKRFEWSDGCDPSKEDCDSMNADVAVYYEGKRAATEDEAKEMMTTVVESIVAEDYGDAEIDLYWLNFNEDLEIIRDGTRGESSSKIGAAVGASLGVVALLTGAFFGARWYRRRKQGEEGPGFAVSQFYRS